MIVCPVDTEQLPKFVSLTTNPCDKAENNFKIINNQPLNGIKLKFGVCVKQMTMESRIQTIKFIEWVHLLRILGVAKIHYYNRFAHHDLFKIMKYFVKMNFLEVNQFLEPTGVPFSYYSWLFQTVEINIVNDCFYRVRNLYEMIAIIDTDEIIMPMRENETSWLNFVDNFVVRSNLSDLYSFRSVTFNPHMHDKNTELPKYHYMLQHTQVKDVYKEILFFKAYL